MMEGLLSTDGLAELQDTWRRFDLHYAGARPWGEFFEQFKPTARDLDTRMATNWLHYKANYAQLTTLVVALGLLWWPTSLFALCVAAIASTAAVTACPGRRIVTVGSYSVKLTTKNRALAAAVAAPLTLIFFGVLTWIALVFSFALVLPVAHMALRPRSLSARYNAASDEVRALFSAAPAASHEEDAEAGVVRDVPVRARAPRGVAESKG